MATARFIVALVLIAFGCALLIVSFQPAQAATLVLVGGRVHDVSLVFLPRAEMATHGNAS